MDTDITSWRNLRHGSVIRGPHDAITDAFAEALGYVFAQMLAERISSTPDQLRIAVGMDPRLSGPRLHKAIIRGITAADSDVFDCGICTTPALHTAAVEPGLHAHGGVMITASHFSSDQNGFMFFTDSDDFTESDTTALILRAEQAVIPDRLVKRVPLNDLYAARLRSMVRDQLEDDSVKPLLGLHVIIDASNGSGGFFAQLLEDMGADITGSINLEPDAQFPHHIPNPENVAALQSISQVVIENKADLGILFDADCDQVAIVDQNGKAIHRNRLIALVAAILLEDDPGATIVTDSVTSSGLADFIAEWGGVHYRYKRGHRNVIEEARRLNNEGIDCPLAIETSGHAAYRDNHFLDDGMYLAMQLVCEALYRKRENQTLSALIDDLHEPVESVEIRMALNGDDPRETGQEVIEAVLSHTLDDPEWSLAPDNREGVRIRFSLDEGIFNAWFLLRMSIHDPVLSLNAESDVPGGVHTMLGRLYSLLEKLEDLDLDLTPLLRASEEYAAD